MTSVLLIEDDLMNQDVLGRLLRWQGYRVEIAPDGATGLARAQAAPPDLIVLDLGLPDHSGYEVLRQLKRGETTRHIPVMVLTAYALDDERAAAIAAGCDAFETKPPDMERMVTTIQRLLKA